LCSYYSNVFTFSKQRIDFLPQEREEAGKSFLIKKTKVPYADGKFTSYSCPVRGNPFVERKITAKYCPVQGLPIREG
jgi:hypothetical protein